MKENLIKELENKRELITLQLKSQEIPEEEKKKIYEEFLQINASMRYIPL